MTLSVSIEYSPVIVPACSSNVPENDTDVFGLPATVPTPVAGDGNPWGRPGESNRSRCRLHRDRSRRRRGPRSASRSLPGARPRAHVTGLEPVREDRLPPVERSGRARSREPPGALRETPSHRAPVTARAHEQRPRGTHVEQIDPIESWGSRGSEQIPAVTSGKAGTPALSDVHAGQLAGEAVRCRH